MKAWEDFLDLQEEQLGVDTVKKWLRPLMVVKFDAGNLYLEAKDSFQALWFEEHIRNKAQTKLLNNNNRHIKIHISVVNSKQQRFRHNNARDIASIKDKSLKNNSPELPSFTGDTLDPHHTFDNIVCSEKNLLCYKLLTKLANEFHLTSHGNNPSISSDLFSFSPVYIYGGMGSGKTHLLMATAHNFKERGMNAIYVRAETFTDHVVKAIRAGEMQEFRKLYRTADVLIVDNVQIFSGKNSTQEEFFHTFNALHLEGHIIILSSNCFPGELRAIEPRLVSRFEWGITIPLESPDRKTMKEILIKKSKIIDFPLSSSVTDFLVSTFSSSTSSLMKALESLILHTHLEQTAGNHVTTPLPLETAQKYLEELIRKEKHDSLSPRKIVLAVAEFYGIKTEDILSKSQNRDVTLPRQIAMNLCRSQLKMPFMKIGIIFSRDHSTVMSSVKRIQKKLSDNDKDATESVHAILRKLQNMMSLTS